MKVSLHIRMIAMFFFGKLVHGLPDMIRFRKLQGRNTKRIMIVAHPDDESLFFSRVLMAGNRDIIVYCLTNGYDSVRRKEFYQALRHYGVRGHILMLPDQTAFSFLFNKRSVSRIIKKLKKRHSACNTIYTHNAEGEYGHRHHVLIGNSVVREFTEADIIVPISGSVIESDTFSLPEHQLRRKEFVFDTCYGSQAAGIIESFPEWFYHEQLVTRKEGAQAIQ